MISPKRKDKQRRKLSIYAYTDVHRRTETPHNGIRQTGVVSRTCSPGASSEKNSIHDSCKPQSVQDLLGCRPCGIGREASLGSASPVLLGSFDLCSAQPDPPS